MVNREQRLLWKTINAFLSQNMKVRLTAKAYPVFARVMEKMNDDWESPVLVPNFYIPGDLEASYHDALTGVINGVYTPKEACVLWIIRCGR